MDISSFATGGIQSGAGFYGGGLAGQRFDRKLAFQVKVKLNVAFSSFFLVKFINFPFQQYHLYNDHQ